MSFKNIFVLLAILTMSASAGFFGSVIHKEISKTKDYYNKSRARFLTVRISDADNIGGGTGVIVKPGTNGLARVLTNGHVCDAISVFPEQEEYYKMSLRESLLLPVDGLVFFDDGKKALVTRILKHSDLPDLCLIETNRPWSYEYASLAKSSPLMDHKYFSVGYPTGNKFVFEGELQQPSLMVHPARILNPIKAKKLDKIEKERKKIFDKIMKLSIDMVLSGTPGEAQLIDNELKILNKKLDSLVEEFRKIISSNRPMLSYSFSVTSVPGSSGSGIWNNRGELVALVWGKRRSTNTAIAIPLPALDRFLTPRLSW